MLQVLLQHATAAATAPAATTITSISSVLTVRQREGGREKETEGREAVGASKAMRFSCCVSFRLVWFRCAATTRTTTATA